MMNKCCLANLPQKVNKCLRLNKKVLKLLFFGVLSLFLEVLLSDSRADEPWKPE